MAASCRGYCCHAWVPVPMFNKCLTKTPFHDPVRFAPGGRASFALPRAILRKASEKAGAGMCRLGSGGEPCVCPPFRFLCHRGLSTLHDIDAFRCIVAEISDNLAGILMGCIYRNHSIINELCLFNVTKSSARLSGI